MKKLILSLIAVSFFLVSIAGVNQAFAVGGKITFTNPSTNGTTINSTNFIITSTYTTGTTTIGNVTNTNTITSFTYSLNGNPPIPLIISGSTYSANLTGLADGFNILDVSQTENDTSIDTAELNFLVNIPTIPIISGDSPLPSHLKPSLGGVPNHIFHDGLTICGGTYDISKYSNQVPQCALPLNTHSEISIKQQFSRGPAYWQHTMIIFNFAGDTNTGNADTWISLDKNDGLVIHDPNHFLSSANAGNDVSGSNVVTTFSLVPAKAMSDSNMIVRVWDASHRSTDAVVNGAILLGDKPIKPVVTLPSGVTKFTDWSALQEKLLSEGFYTPRIMSHIHGSTSDAVQVYWLYDTNINKITLVEEDQNGNKLFSQTEQLEKINHTITNACNVASFSSLCGSGSIYGFSANTPGLTESQVQHLVDMGMWSGAIPRGMHITTASH